jgi:hypothetical protein
VLQDDNVVRQHIHLSANVASDANDDDDAADNDNDDDDDDDDDEDDNVDSDICMYNMVVKHT